MTPEKEQQLLDDVRDIKLAVVGDRSIGVEGLVEEVHKLKKWRAKQDLRIMFISGIIVGTYYLAKTILHL